MLATLALVGALALGAPGRGPADTLSSAALRLRPAATSVGFLAPVRATASVVSGKRSDPAPVEPSAGPTDGADPQLVEYSDAYFTRLQIHKWASWLTVPLFVGQYAVGQKLINGDGSDRLRGVHGLLAGSIAGLFAVNTVTGGLNAIEAWKDPEGRNRRTIHTVLMLLADAGFVVTGATAQENENEGGFRTTGNNNTHRNVALASMGTALLGVVVMLPIFGR